jgi:hypothetical protein
MVKADVKFSLKKAEKYFLHVHIYFKTILYEYKKFSIEINEYLVHPESNH